MKKILIGVGYVNFACLFIICIVLAFSNMPRNLNSWLEAVFFFMLGVCGLGAFFLKKPYRLSAVIFLVWLLGLGVSLTCVPGWTNHSLHTFWTAWDSSQGRLEVLRGLFFCTWSIFGMAQAFIKEPPRDTVIIVHSLLTVLIFGLWVLPFNFLKSLLNLVR